MNRYQPLGLIAAAALTVVIGGCGDSSTEAENPAAPAATADTPATTTSLRPTTTTSATTTTTAATTTTTATPTTTTSSAPDATPRDLEDVLNGEPNQAGYPVEPGQTPTFFLMSHSSSVQISADPYR